MQVSRVRRKAVFLISRISPSWLHWGWVWTSLGSPTNIWMSMSDSPVNNIKYRSHINNMYIYTEFRSSDCSSKHIGLWPILISIYVKTAFGPFIYVKTAFGPFIYIKMAFGPFICVKTAFGPFIYIKTAFGPLSLSKRPLVHSFIRIRLLSTIPISKFIRLIRE